MGYGHNGFGIKKVIITIGITCALCTAGQAFGAYSCYTSAPSLPSGYRSSSLGQKGSNCASTQRMYWCSPNDQACDGYTTCATCPSGYQMCGVSGSGSMCNTITYYDCKTSCSTGGGDPEEPEEPKCEKDVNCFDDEYFTRFYRDGYLRKTIRACDNTANVCREVAELYICDIGYYGIDGANPTASSSVVCNRCPLNGVTSNSSSSITACYLWSGATGGDSTGLFSISGGNCYWEE